MTVPTKTRAELDSSTVLIFETNILRVSPVKGGGDKGYFFVKLDFEIAVDQQTRTGDPTFGGGPGLRPPTGARGAATPIFGPNLAQFWQIT